MDEIVISYIDSKAEFPYVRSNRTFFHMDPAIKFYKTIDKRLEPLIERTCFVTMMVDVEEAEKEFIDGYDDAKNFRYMKVEANYKNDYYWSYYDGYTKGESER